MPSSASPNNQEDRFPTLNPHDAADDGADSNSTEGSLSHPLRNGNNNLHYRHSSPIVTGITSMSHDESTVHSSLPVAGQHHASRRRHTTDTVNIDADKPGGLAITDPNVSELEHRRQVLNSLWGIKPYKGHITKRELNERSDVVKELYKPVAGWEAVKGKEEGEGVGTTRQKIRNRMVGLGNIAYTLFFGWWLALMYVLVGCLCFLSIIEIPYGKKCIELAKYYFWPFGKYLEIIETKIDPETAYLMGPKPVLSDSASSLQGMEQTEPDKSRKYYSEPGGETEMESEPSSKPFYVPNLYAIHTKRTALEWIRYIIFVVFFCPLLVLSHFICMTVSWFTIFFIPVSKVQFQGMKILYKDPIKVATDDHYPPAPGSDIILCTYQAFNIFYYKYSVFGMNVILINLLPFVFITLLLAYCFGEEFVETYSFIIFPLCLISTVPLAYYIGKAVSSISAQTSFAFGAVLNAAFGTIIELILYFIALHKGMRMIVMNSITGSLIGSMLLMPGAAMIFGGLKHKEQFFNRHAAGVSATLLLMAVIGAFTPSIFYQIYGHYRLECGNCKPSNGPDSPMTCSSCHYYEQHYEEDYVYSHKARYLMYVCSVLLPLGYIFGLIFTLKTHTYLYEKPVGDPEDPESLEKPTPHGAPEWSKIKCILILFFSTVLFAFVAEAMISAMGPAMEFFHLDDRFASVTLIAVVPNISEYINAAAFGLQNNIVLSLEIGSVAAIQTALLQMPILVLASALLGWLGVYKGEEAIFTLIFPSINVYTVVFSVLIITYLTVNGRSNYFEGGILVLCYIIIVSTFFFTYEDL